MAILNKILGLTETIICNPAVAIESPPSPGETWAVLSMVFCNTSAADVTVTIYAYPAGGIAGDGSTIVKNVLIASSDSFVWTASEKFIIGPGDIISAVANTVDAITVTPTFYKM